MDFDYSPRVEQLRKPVREFMDDYAPLAEVMGRVMWASEAFNCSPPDTGHMEILHPFSTPGPRQSGAAPRHPT